MVGGVLLGANWTQTKEKPGEFWVKIEFSAILRIVLRVNFGLRWYVVYQNALLWSIINCHTDAYKGFFDVKNGAQTFTSELG